MIRKRTANYTFWQKAELLPPILVRLLARYPDGPPFTDQEIVGRSNLSLELIRLIYWQTTWEHIALLPTMRQFLLGCDLDFEDGARFRRVSKYLNSNPRFTYLRRSPEWSTLYEPLMVHWEKSFPP